MIQPPSPASRLRLRRGAIALAVIAAVGLVYASARRADAADLCSGPGCDTVALVDSQARFHLFENLETSSVSSRITFGNPGDEPLMGDWDCNGVQTPGMYRRSSGFMYLRNSNTSGAADLQFYFGNPGDIPLAGDFDGDGDIDLAASVNGGDSVSVILNNGDGTFAGRTQYGVGGSPWGIQSADFNLDGALDIACVNYNSNNVTILDNMVVGIEESQPSNTSPLLLIFPNPFRDKVNIQYCIGSGARGIELKIYDATGRLIKQFNNSTIQPFNQIVWDGTDNSNREVPNGVYFCRVKSSDLTVTKQIILIR